MTKLITIKISQLHFVPIEMTKSKQINKSTNQRFISHRSQIPLSSHSIIPTFSHSLIPSFSHSIILSFSQSLIVSYLHTMSVASFIKDIEKGHIQPLYFIYGDEPFYIDQLTKAVDGILDEAAKSFNQVTLYGRDVDFKAVMDHARQFPMMSSHRVVILKEAQTMRSLDQLASYVENPAPQTVLLIAYKKDRFDKRTKFAKAISKHAVVLESKKLYQNKVPAWITNYVSAKGLQIHPKASAILAEHIGADLAKLSNELDKVCINLEENQIINFDMIMDQVGINRDYNVFEFRSALGKKDLAKAMEIANYFGDNAKSHPIQMLLPSVFSYFVQIFQTKSMGGLPDGQLARSIGVNPYFVSEYKSAARLFHPEHIKQIFTKLSETDLLSKGVGARKVKSKDLLQDLVFTIAR